MGTPAAPAASGGRLLWRDMPAGVRAWVDERLGSSVVGAVDEPGGFSPGPESRVRCADGTRAFVKAAGPELNPDSPEMHRREARVTAALPPSPWVPQLLDTYDDGAWVALLYTEIDGRNPRVPWDATELDTVLTMVGRLHATLTPCPIAGIDSLVERPGEDFTGWRTLAALERVPATLDGWSVRNLDRLAAIEPAWEAASEGDTLVHADLRADNMLMTGAAGAHSVVFVDWAHACRGVAWFDIVCWAPSVAMQGGPPPETLMARNRGAAAIDGDALPAVVAAVAGYFTEAQTRPPPPGLPTLRAFQAAQGVEARAWLQRLTGWR